MTRDGAQTGLWCFCHGGAEAERTNQIALILLVPWEKHEREPSRVVYGIPVTCHVVNFTPDQGQTSSSDLQS